MEKITPTLADAILLRIFKIKNEAWTSQTNEVNRRINMCNEIENLIHNHLENKN